ncbi:hypothetical protein [Kribbella kalugense]|uniref:Uncharacterized protein n=1 Tax=Kribbella kalugense TaxID=2512221 RepID=A0A4R8A162_9ACTN|nr:hypothetical protein [Kribbella kalugense]TDW24233.1 hypothetical protein EV650_3105 [Kribbella kalugense]
MKISRKAIALVACMALAGCGHSQSPTPAGNQQQSDKSPLAEYMGDGFLNSSSSGISMVAHGGNNGQPTEEELAKQRKVEDATAACMKAAGFDYVAVPPDQKQKGKFTDAFNLPPDKFAEQYGYGISTIDWSKAGPGSDDSDPNKKIRNALSPAAKKAYDKALDGPNADGNGVISITPGTSGKGSSLNGKTDLGCRGKAADEVYGSDPNRAIDPGKFESLFSDIQALGKQIDSDQRVVDATSAWSDCLADAGHSGFKKIDDPRQQVQQKLDALTGTSSSPGGAPGKVSGPPSFDKVDATKLAELRKFEIEVAVADQNCKAKVYDQPYKKVQYEAEKEFVDQHKSELEAYRDEMANK